MKNEFIPYEEALALKELGFDEECFGYYNSFGRFIEDKVLTQEGDMPSAPLYQQAFRWFREEHNVDCYIEKDRKNRYWFYITVNTLINKSSKFCFHRYEKAELACLRKLIEIVKQKQDE